jgi:hypothetical protein
LLWYPFYASKTTNIKQPTQTWGDKKDVSGTGAEGRTEKWNVP